MFVISPTDLNWFNFIKDNYIAGYVNFWTPTPWKISNLPIGSKWYFKKKGGGKLICGYGNFNGIKIMTIKEAWQMFGPNNGCNSFASFKKCLGSYNTYISEEKKIGAILLSDVVCFDEQYYVDLDLIGVEWSNNIVKYKKYDQEDTILSNIIEHNAEIDIPSFVLISQTAKKKKASDLSLREGQSAFRQKIASVYGYKCCITGESCPELLEAAHIQPYISKDSNHVQNGMLLRVDFHRLFDSGLLAIDEDYCVKISDLLKSSYYKKYDGCKILLPSNECYYPSKMALRLKMEELR